ncbi:prephenate dehydratase [Actinospongicola halichondriae]|uniref:prephenate dehydratase n=1 Tax=Actinospongicola halichondriae TaxID=3236844 RepID=UPI003D57BC23
MTPPADTSPLDTPGRIAFLGPEGTFSEQALLTQPDYAAMELVACRTIPEVLHAVSDGAADVAFVPIENAIEGSVNVTLDALIFDHELKMQREVVINVVMCLLAPAGVGLADIDRVLSIPVATAQCRSYLSEHLPDADELAANSTAVAARMVAEERDGRTAAIGTALAAKVHGLEVLAEDIEDHADNQTRFVALTRQGIPAPSGHDKTSIVVFQKADVPGSLLTILQEFAARGINLTRLESRPTKRGLGDYCFIIDLEGHVGDELVADALRDLKSKNEDVLFLGSYHAAGDHGPEVRRDAEAAWRDANDWLDRLRDEIR